MRILIADDNAINRELLIEVLSARGHSVTGACDGLAVLAAAEKENFEVVLMDEEMPAMGGIEATRAMREKDLNGRNRPIIVGVSGNSTDADKKRCLSAGMDAFLAKPVPLEQLLEVIDFYGRASQSPPRLQPPSPPADSSSETLAARMKNVTGGDEKIFRSLTKTFIKDTSKKLAALRHAVSKDEFQKVEAVAHSMKGSFGLFGAQKAVAIARNLQAIGNSGNLDGASLQLHALEEEFNLLRREIGTLQKQSKPAPKITARRRPASSRSRRKR